MADVMSKLNAYSIYGLHGDSPFYSYIRFLIIPLPPRNFSCSVTKAMSRHGSKSAKEAGAANTEAFRGALVGAAKVNANPTYSALLRCYPLFQYRSTQQPLSAPDELLMRTVGPHRRRSRVCRLFPLPHLSRLNGSIQSVRRMPPLHVLLEPKTSLFP